MSLSSFLLNSSVPVDAGLDSLFKTATVHAPTSKPIPGPTKEFSKKRKVRAERDADTPSKRVKPSPRTSSEKPKIVAQNDPKSDMAAKPRKKNRKGKERAKEPVVTEDEGDDDDNSDLENAYTTGKSIRKTTEEEEDLEDNDSDPDSDGDQVPTALVHESLQKNREKSSRTAKQKYVPEDETPNLRNRRTIFVGNLPIELASKRPLSKQLQRHILAFVPTARIESVRFRSIPFQTPTSKLPTADDEGDDTKTKLKPQTPKKDARPHDRERASVWRSKAIDKDEAVVKQDEKKYITPGQKKKIAFINQEFHSTADTVNAYIVFAHSINYEDRPSNLPPIPPTLDPYEAARLAAEKCDGTLFMERMIRVDLVGKNNEMGSTVTTKEPALIDTDPKLSVFVGNLDFASKEEDLRVFFESLLASEKGLPPAHDDTDEGGLKKPLTWVTRVRIVRDKDTQLGKGFAYVQFVDRGCVDELLALEETKLKFAKRKLRVQRCKTLPGSKLSVMATSKSKSKTQTPAAIVIPKGDPLLGEKLAGLSKDERKQRKSTDADRVARRLAKKKARMVLAPGIGVVKSQRKDRERARKITGRRKTSSGSSQDSKAKGRIRSAESVARKNTKK